MQLIYTDEKHYDFLNGQLISILHTFFFIIILNAFYKHWSPSSSSKYSHWNQGNLEGFAIP